MVGGIRHGHSPVGNYSRTYTIWLGMTKRCRDENATGFHLYGGRGIKVCERWKSFINFLADMGEAPIDLSIDRYPDKNGDYEPGNCRWATDAEQKRNTNRTRMIAFDGIEMCLRDWERHLDLGYGTLWRRLARGEQIPFALRKTK